MNGYWILAASIYTLVGVVMLIDEHRCGSRWFVKIGCIFWLQVLIAGLLITEAALPGWWIESFLVKAIVSDSVDEFSSRAPTRALAILDAVCAAKGG